MKKLLLFGMILALGTVVYAQDITVEEIEKRSELATDPEGKLESIKTKIMKAEVLIKEVGMKASLVIKSKEPGKTNSVQIIPNVITEVKVFDGNESWQYSNVQGLRQVTGKELMFSKFQAKLDDPKLKMTDIFEKVILAPEKTKIGEFNCYKITGIASKEDGIKPMSLYFDDKSFLPRKMEMLASTVMGDIPINIFFNEYKKYDGILMPYKTTASVMGMNMVITFTSIEFNKEVDDFEFTKAFIEKIQKETRDAQKARMK